MTPMGLDSWPLPYCRQNIPAKNIPAKNVPAIRPDALAAAITISRNIRPGPSCSLIHLALRISGKL